jgi:NAD(P)-dependent dehydrogenase (short-subunit alcohol dehydrogenase family)
MPAQPADLLRPGLLEGTTVAVAGNPQADGRSPAQAVAGAAAQLGAAVAEVALSDGESAERNEQEVSSAFAGALAQLGSIEALVVDCASLFEQRSGRQALIGSLATGWNAARAAAQLAFLPAGAGGRIVLIAPRAGTEMAAPAVAGLENLARTLSIEWARHAITTTAIAPGQTTAVEELAALVCYLLSPAGAYFSGCLMDLRGPTR